MSERIPNIPETGGRQPSVGNCHSQIWSLFSEQLIVRISRTNIESVGSVGWLSTISNMTITLTPRS